MTICEWKERGDRDGFDMGRYDSDIISSRARYNAVLEQVWR